ncbi:MAG: sensor histidine kinase, partial [Giesbergeria sp.]
RIGLALCVRDGRALGAGSGRYDELPDAYLPLRGRGVTLGAALVSGLARHPQGHELRPHLQALCDQMGSALHRSLMAAQEQQARDQAQLQATRNALLAAISHDYRTPLATIMGAASALQEQGERMDGAQRQRLAAGIVEESERLARLTDNTLQLARLDAPTVQLRCDWESAEEIVGAVLRRARRRPEGARVHAWVEPNLPLLWCDAMLVSQLLDNLLDNGLKYSPADAPVELHATRDAEHLVLAVSDRGPGIAPAWREKVFEVFQRGDAGPSESPADAGRGSGVGLAVCRAIARAHQGELLLRPRAEGGCRFECRLPLCGESPPPQSAPAAPESPP